jgi:hypothetical protein
MADQQFFVNYTVELGQNRPKYMQAGPYPTVDVAEDHRRDIAGYVGISQAWIGNHRDEKRQLVQ